MNFDVLYQKIIKLHRTLPLLFSKGKAFPPLQIFLETTYKCNQRCVMCQFLSIVERYPAGNNVRLELTTEEIKRAIRQFPRNSLITLTGGEPTVRKDIMEIVEYASSLNKCHLITNGTLLTEDRCVELVGLGCANLLSKGLIMVGVSLEGSTPERHDNIVRLEGAFSKAVEAIKRLKMYKEKSGKKYPLLNISMVVSKDNVHEMSGMLSLAEELGVDILGFLAYNTSPFLDRYANYSREEIMSYKREMVDIDIDILKEQFAIIEERKKKSRVQVRFTPQGSPTNEILRYYQGVNDLNDYQCYFPWSKVIVTATGEVMFCYNNRIGNIRENSFKEIWNNDKAVRYRNEFITAKLPEACSGCCVLEYKGEK